MRFPSVGAKKLLRLKPEPFEDCAGAEPGHLDGLLRAALAAGYLNGTLRQVQTLGQQRDYGLVGAALEGRRRHLHAQRAAVHAGDFFAPRPRLHLDPETNIPTPLFHLKTHAGPGRGPKSAVPRRTWVAPSSMATSKSWLIPMESSFIATRGRRRRSISSPSSRRRRK